MRKIIRIALLALAAVGAISAQESIGTYQVRISLDRADWTYELNRPAKFSIATTLNNTQTAGVPVKYSCGPEQQPAVIEKTLVSSEQPIVIETPGMNDPGFYRCIATVEKDGRTYRGIATAGYRSDQIKPVVAETSDFDKY